MILSTKFHVTKGFSSLVLRSFATRAAEVNANIIFQPFHEAPKESIFSSNPLKTLRLNLASTRGLCVGLYSAYQIKRKVKGFDGGKFAKQVEPLMKRFMEAYVLRDDAALRLMVTTTLADKLKLSTGKTGGKGRRYQKGKKVRSKQSNSYDGFRLIGYDKPSTVRQMRVFSDDRTVSYGQVTCRFHAQYVPVRYLQNGDIDMNAPLTLENNKGVQLVEKEYEWEPAYNEHGLRFFYNKSNETTWQQPVEWQSQYTSINFGPSELNKKDLEFVSNNDEEHHPHPEIIHMTHHVVFEIKLLNNQPTWQIAGFL